MQEQQKKNSLDTPMLDYEKLDISKSDETLKAGNNVLNLAINHYKNLEYDLFNRQTTVIRNLLWLSATLLAATFALIPPTDLMSLASESLFHALLVTILIVGAALSLLAGLYALIPRKYADPVAQYQEKSSYVMENYLYEKEALLIDSLIKAYDNGIQCSTKRAYQRGNAIFVMTCSLILSSASALTCALIYFF